MILECVNLTALPEIIKKHFKVLKLYYVNMNDSILYNHNAIEELENLFESGKLCRLVLDEDENDVYIPMTEIEIFT